MRRKMAATSREPNSKPQKPQGIRIAILIAVVVVVFFAGLGVGVLLEQASLPTIRVTPSVEFIGYDSQNVSFSSSCTGGSQSSFNGYFECGVTVACAESGTGNLIVQNASAPAASNLVVTPNLPRNLPCDSQDDFQVAGQLGYTGSVTIYFEV
jgi:hypothetical protein